MKGDEIMVINGAIVSDLDMMFIESVLQEELTLCMMLRSCRPGNCTYILGSESKKMHKFLLRNFLKIIICASLFDSDFANAYY